MGNKKGKNYKTTCSYCGVGCGMVVNKDINGKLKVDGDADYPVNKGMLCSKGMNINYVVQDKSDRLLYPQMKWSKNHDFQRVSWDAALDRTAATFKSLIEKHGPDSVAFYVSGQCLTEEYYILNKLTKGFLGTNNIDTNSRLCMSSAVVGYKKTLGEDSVPISYEDIELADTFFIAGANPAWCHPILFRRLEARKEENPNVKIIVVDPRKTDTCSISDLHLQLRPGTDVVLYNAINRVLIEKGAIDQEFISNHSEGYQKYHDHVMEMSIDAASELCDVPKEQIELAAEYIAESNGLITMWAMGLNQSQNGVDKNFALLNISLLTGKIGKPGNGPFSLTGQPNAMGGREVGGLSTMLAARRALNSKEDREEIANFWGVDSISPKPGYTATEIIDKIHEGKLKALWVVCTNPLVSLPDLNKVEKALEKVNFLVVQDISSKSDTTKYADVILPAAGWAEKKGTMTNSERRVSYLPKIIDPPGEALPDAEIICKFGQKMGFDGFDFDGSKEIYDEYVLMTKGTNIDVSGLSHKRLKKKGSFQWPVPHKKHMGTPRLFEDKIFYTNSEKAIFNTPSQLQVSGQISEDFPLVLTTGRIRDQWHTMTRTGKVNRLKSHISTPFLEIHPNDAGNRGFVADQLAKVSSGNGEVTVKIKITKDIKEGVVFLPMHWGKILGSNNARANNLTYANIDPLSKQPEFKLTGVEVEALVKKSEKICVVGGGAAAYRFTQTYRDLNKKDELVVFSKESTAFYNRVLLPEYINGKLSWEELIKIKKERLDSQNIQLYSGVSINHIDRDNKVIVDSNGQEHDYDKLVLATGSSPFVPREVPRHFNGIFTMRRKEDADRLKTYLSKSVIPSDDQKVLIVGGGLLGLEVASALREMGINITIVQRASTLMERQLDLTASKILANDIKERNIQVYFDDEVYTITERENQQMSINLRSGKNLICDAVIYAIGAIPNVNLAKESGLTCNRGVVVNEYLQTSDPDIYALGEIAEFNSHLYGITSAAEEQANILAPYLNGDSTKVYKGSILMNILKFHDLNLVSIGDVQTYEDDDRYEEIVFLDMAQKYYKKCFIYEERLIGAILIGDKTEFAEFKVLIEDKIELSNLRSELLRSGGVEKVVLGKMVCSCSQVGVGNIEECVKNGAEDLISVCAQTGAGLGCGSCKPEIKQIIESTLVTA